MFVVHIHHKKYKTSTKNLNVNINFGRFYVNRTFFFIFFKLIIQDQLYRSKMFTHLLSHLFIHSQIVSFYGQNQASWASCSPVPTFIKPFKTLPHLCDDLQTHFRPLGVLPKPIFNPKKVLSKVNQASWASWSQDPTIIKPTKTFFNLWDVFQIHPQPLGSISKASIQPQESICKGLK